MKVSANIEALADLDLIKKGERLPVMEVFYTIQGEGRNAGAPAIFIRLAGCDVGCHWCDVKESWTATDHKVYSIQELKDEISQYPCKNIVITGGEPLMYKLDVLCSSLKEDNYLLWMETSGAYELNGEWDWICLSPKKTKLPVQSVIDQAHELKCIVFNQSDYDFAEEHAEKVGTNCELFLQVEWSVKEKRLPSLIQYVKDHPKWKISTQTHKYLDIP